MDKKLFVLGFVLLIAFVFVVTTTLDKSIKSYDDIVNTSLLVEDNYPSGEGLMGGNITLIKSFALWDPLVLDLDNEMKIAEVIVVGTVKEIKSSQKTTVTRGNSNDVLDYVYTDIVLEVDKYLKNKGEKGDEQIIVRKEGGCVEDLCYEVEDEPSFKPGEKVFLLLTSRDTYTSSIESEHFRVLDGIHGKFKISKGYAIRDRVPNGYRVYRLDDLTNLATKNKDTFKEG